jgi:hypothetical protein
MSEKDDIASAEDQKTSDLLALLYGESSDSAIDEEGLSEELDGMKMVRSLFAEMPDEEPPLAISNKLLAAAAQSKHISTKSEAEESPGLFSRITHFFMPLVYHPGIAAAASVVLVIGLAGTLYVKGDLETVEPMTTSLEPPLADEEFADPAEPLPEATMERAAVAEDTVAEDTAAEDIGDLKEEESFADKPAEAAAPQPTDGQRVGSGGGKLDLATPSNTVGGLVEPVTGRQQGQRSNIEKSTITEKKKAPAKTQAPGKKGKKAETENLPSPKTKNRVMPSQQAKPPPPPAPASVDADQVESDDEAEAEPEEGRAKGPSNDPAPAPAPAPEPSKTEDPKPKASTTSKQAAALHRMALKNAKKNLCSRVLGFGQKIKTLDVDYYENKFLRDPGLQACFQPVKKKK